MCYYGVEYGVERVYNEHYDFLHYNEYNDDYDNNPYVKKFGIKTHIGKQVVIIHMKGIEKIKDPVIHICDMEIPFWKSPIFNMGVGYDTTILLLNPDTSIELILECVKCYISNITAYNISDSLIDVELQSKQQILAQLTYSTHSTHSTSPFIMQSGINFTKPITFNTDTFTIENTQFLSKEEKLKKVNEEKDKQREANRRTNEDKANKIFANLQITRDNLLAKLKSFNKLNIEDFRDNKDLKSLKAEIVKFRDDKPGKIISENLMINKNFIELQKPIKKFIDLTINLKALKHKINAIFDTRVAELEEEFERYKYEYHTFDSFLEYDDKKYCKFN